jgi:hypothetical protein
MANTLNLGTDGNWATKKNSLLAYNSENENYKPLPFNFERDSIATRVNKEGLIEVVGKDIPRIDYTDSADGVLLLENASTNLVAYSEDMSNGSWTKSNSNITSNNIISPDGSLNADKLKEDSTNTFHRLANVLSISNGVSYSVSIFVKKAERRYVRFASAFGSGDALTDFDILNGTVLNGNGSIKDYGNGWFKITNNFTADSTLTSINVFQLFLLNDNKVRNYQGDGTSGVYVWGAMLEANSFATSYIPTSGSTVPRAAETATDSGNSEVFNDSEGVLFADISAFAGAGGGTRRIEVSNGINASQYVRLQIANGDGSLYSIVNNGTEQFLFNATSFNATLSNKIILKYKQNDFSLFLNGFEVGSNNVGNTFANGVLKQVNFSSTASEFYGKTKEVGYYDIALTDEELEYITSYRSLNELVTELNLNTL